MPKFYTSVIHIINQSKEFCKSQFSAFGSRGGQISPLMHVPLRAYVFIQEVAFIVTVNIKLRSKCFLSVYAPYHF